MMIKPFVHIRNVGLFLVPFFLVNGISCSNSSNGYWSEYGIKNGVKEEHYPTGELHYRGTVEGYLHNGKYQEFFKNGFVKHEGQKQDGRRIGTWKEFTNTGELRSTTEYDGTDTIIHYRRVIDQNAELIVDLKNRRMRLSLDSILVSETTIEEGCFSFPSSLTCEITGDNQLMLYSGQDYLLLNRLLETTFNLNDSVISRLELISDLSDLKQLKDSRYGLSARADTISVSYLDSSTGLLKEERFYW